MSIFIALFAVALLSSLLLLRLLRTLRIGRLCDRYVMITGCDTGFGNLVARRLDREGCRVFAGCLTEKAETELRKLCSSRLKTFSLDVTSHDSILRGREFVKQYLPAGRGKLIIIMNVIYPYQLQ